MSDPSPPSKSSSNATKPKKRFVGSKSARPSKPGVQPVLTNQVPPDILNDDQLNAAIRQLPSNYSFEVHKTIHHIRKNNASMVALQMPEGLQMFACTIADIIERFTNALTVIMGDVTYGACCIDDYTAVALGCDMMVHYGHSCLVPVDQTAIKTLYVFVEIGIDSAHLHQERLLDAEEELSRIPAGQQIASGMAQLRIEGPSIDSFETELHSPTASAEPTRLALVSTIQFVAALQKLKEDLSTEYTPVAQEKPSGLISNGVDGNTSNEPVARTKYWTGAYEATIPRSKPLSPGEILGCTAPFLKDVDALIYLGDGRFHLESIMIANPDIPAFRYDPYSKKFTRERYNHLEMQTIRDQAVQTARKSIEAYRALEVAEEGPPLWGVVLGTLGRQGNVNQMQAITRQLEASSTSIPYIPILLSELSPAKLALFNPHISTFIQTSCPRLSIDWGYAFDRPLLSPYETAVAVGAAPSWLESKTESKSGIYPMNFYEAGSPWAVSRAKGSF
ncbi:hypothetical protein NP233_g8971 [Leucocoprinus birnbaumii]|uniref:2-(3-amino-3-carboxypropyl)histidine synthase subunit 1 n=1 Tax=Leucocoprinus birnbaumii TaxID=56174 RepID=A0AAD5YMM9_9AGAR|nr:hypothetical protein NP233_g8971 [Leucocoprinus birnbaumii]